MKKKSNLAITGIKIFILFLIPLLFSSCDFFRMSKKTGTLILTLSSNLQSKSIVPNISLDVDHYDISGTGPDNNQFSVSDVSESNYTRYDLVPGEWEVTAIAKNAAGDSIGADTQTVSIEARKTSAVSLTCQLIIGYGSLSLSISWPKDTIAQPDIVATLYPESGTSYKGTVELDATSGAISFVNLPNGYYTLSVQLLEKYGDGKIVWGRVEAALILANRETSGSWDLLQTDISLYQSGGIDISVGNSIKKPVAVKIENEISQLLLGSNHTVMISQPESYDAIQWYLNGAPLQGSTSGSCTFGSDLPLGTYWLDVVVKVDGALGSQGFKFDVKSVLSTVSIENNSMWNQYVYFSWRNIRHVYQPNSENAVIDTWKYDDNGNGDPRDDQNRILWNGQTDNANGLWFGVEGVFTAQYSGWSVNAYNDSEGNGVLEFSVENATTSAFAQYTLKPDSKQLEGELTYKAKESSSNYFMWGFCIISGVWVSNPLGDLAIYDEAVLNNTMIHARDSAMWREEWEEDIDYIKLENQTAGIMGVQSTSREWSLYFELIEASKPVEMRAAVIMASPYNGWGFDRRGWIRCLLGKDEEIHLKGVFKCLLE